MDYEKKYKEAMERAKQGRPMDEVFPELVESEDERIRKEIMEYLTITREKDLVAHPERQRWIAYLKKQKIISDNLKAVGIDVRQDGGIERHTIPYLEKQKEQKDYNKLYEDIAKSEWFKTAYEGKSLGCDYEPAEQKPTESSEDERIVNFIKGIIMGAKRGSTLKIGAKSANECIAYLEKQKRVKPAEWSDEDDAIYTRVLGILGKAFMGVIPSRPSQEDIEWFKSLPERFNLHPKQVWSEGDINRHYYLCKLLRETWDKVDKGSCIDDAITWLEKLPEQIYPHSWKPSEEQMEVMEYYIHTLICNRNKEVLFGLYNDLKKL